MNILYCGDSQITDGLIMSTLSILQYERGTIHFYLFTMDYTGPAPIKQSLAALALSRLPARSTLELRTYHRVAPKTIRVLQKIVKKINPANTFTAIDVASYFQAELPAANLRNMFTPYCLLRLYADQVPAFQKVSKLLYLDNDVLTCRPFRQEFYNRDLTDYEVAGVCDDFVRHAISPAHKSYLNSGVLLINLAKVKQLGTFACARHFCAATRSFLPDQTALNKFCQHKLIFPRRYNEQQQLRQDTVFRHFTTAVKMLPYPRAQRVKPWDLPAMHQVLHCHDFDDLYADFQKVKEQL